MSAIVYVSDETKILIYYIAVSSYFFTCNCFKTKRKTRKHSTKIFALRHSITHASFPHIQEASPTSFSRPTPLVTCRPTLHLILNFNMRYVMLLGLSYLKYNWGLVALIGPN